MVIDRKRPNTHTIEGVQFHPGVQLISDEIYTRVLKNNDDFKNQIAAKHMEIVTASSEDKPDGTETKPTGKVAQSLAEIVANLSTKKAKELIERTIDAVDLQEIARLDKRQVVVKAANEQLTQRQATMNGMSPAKPEMPQGDLDLGVRG